MSTAMLCRCCSPLSLSMRCLCCAGRISAIADLGLAELSSAFALQFYAFPSLCNVQSLPRFAGHCLCGAVLFNAFAWPSPAVPLLGGSRRFLRHAMLVFAIPLLILAGLCSSFAMQCSAYAPLCRALPLRCSALPCLNGSLLWRSLHCFSLPLLSLGLHCLCPALLFPA